MTDVPDEEERERLLDAMARLNDRAGSEPLLVRPMVLATPRFFPDPVPATVGGVRALIRRLLVFAGLPEVQPTLQIYEDGDEIHAELLGTRRAPHEDVPAFFAGIEADTAYFGFHAKHFDDPDRLLGILAHEVAHAYRARRGIEVVSRSVEEELTDLTAIHLGFGALIVNASFVHRSEGQLDGAFASHRVEVKRTGYLPPESVAFAFAIQLALRAPSSKERAPILEELDRDRATSVRACLRVLPSRQELVARLRLPEPSTWPAPIDVDENELAAVDDQDDDDALLVDDDAGDPGDDATYRIPALRGGGGVAVGGVGGLLLGSALALAVNLGGGVILGLAVLGGVLVPLLRLHRCADPDCDKLLVGATPSCAGCRRPIVGDLASRADWLDAPRRRDEPDT